MRKLNSSSKFNEGSWVGDNEKKGTLWFEVIKSLEDPKLKLADHNLGKNGKILVHKNLVQYQKGYSLFLPGSPTKMEAVKQKQSANHNH